MLRFGGGENTYSVSGAHYLHKTSRNLHKLQSDFGLLVMSIDDSKDIEVHLSLSDFTLVFQGLINSKVYLSLSLFTSVCLSLL